MRINSSYETVEKYFFEGTDTDGNNVYAVGVENNGVIIITLTDINKKPLVDENGNKIVGILPKGEYTITRFIDYEEERANCEDKLYILYVMFIVALFISFSVMMCLNLICQFKIPLGAFIILFFILTFTLFILFYYKHYRKNNNSNERKWYYEEKRND